MSVWVARFCFADAATAETFKAEFARELQISPMPKDDLAAPHIRGDDDAAFAILAADLVRAGLMDCALRNDGDRR
jgi:hypothetical protein